MPTVVEPDPDPGDAITLVTGLEGPVNRLAPVTCGYCHHEIVADDDHATDCCWHAGKAAAR